MILLSSVRNKAVSGEGLLPLPPHFSSLIATQQKPHEVSLHMTLSEGKDCRVYDGLEYKEEVGGEVDSKDGVGVDIRVRVRTA